MTSRRALGVDIGGSGIKAAVVDTAQGILVGERRRVETPSSLLPDDVLSATAQLAAGFPKRLPLGVGFPAVVVDGVVKSPFTAHQVPDWLGVPVAERLRQLTGRQVVVVNDADAAGIGEMMFGSGQGEKGVVLVFTLGTGIGSALFVDGVLVPNLELGHLYLRGRRRAAEWRAAASARDREGLKWSEYAARVDEYLHHVERLFTPQLIIIGGGVSSRADKFIPRLTVEARVVAASLHNLAGIIGAATLAATVAARGGGIASRRR